MELSISISKKIERVYLPDSRLVKEDQLIRWKWKLGPVECLPLSLRNGVLHSSSGDPQVEDRPNSQGDVHGESYSQLEIFSTTYWTVVKHTIVKLGKRTPSRSGNRIGIGRQVCNNMLRPGSKRYFIWMMSRGTLLTYWHLQVNNHSNFGSLKTRTLLIISKPQSSTWSIQRDRRRPTPIASSRGAGGPGKSHPSIARSTLLTLSEYQNVSRSIWSNAICSILFVELRTRRCNYSLTPGTKCK